MEKKSTVFIKGFYPNKITDKVPEFIFGHGAIKPETLIEWLQQNKHFVNEKGYMPYQINQNKDGDLYMKVDMWKLENPMPQRTDSQQAAQQIENHNKGYQEFTGRKLEPNETVSLTDEQVSDIPF